MTKTAKSTAASAKSQNKKAGKKADKKTGRASGKARAKPQPEVAGEPVELRIVKAALELAAEKGWSEVSSVEVAKRAGLPVEDVRSLCPDKVDVLRLLAEEINIAMLDGGEVDGSVRDNLFELIMRRLDVLQQHRAGVLAVVDGLKREPGVALRLAGTLYEMIGHILDMAGVSISPLHRAALAAVELSVFKTWCEDESADMAATMAMLDHRLGQLDQAAETLQPFLRHEA